MSLPEVLLILNEHARRESSQALLQLHIQALSTFAVWDKDAGRRLEQLRKVLGESLGPEESASEERLSAVFTGWGVVVETDGFTSVLPRHEPVLHPRSP